MERSVQEPGSEYVYVPRHVYNVHTCSLETAYKLYTSVFCFLFHVVCMWN